MTAQIVHLKDRKRAQRAMPVRLPNSKLRSREYLTPTEVNALLKAAGRRGRYGQRDACLILIAYRHGLRVSEIVSLRWDQIDLKAGHLHVRRAKNGTPSTHPLQGDELRALRQLAREWPDRGGFLFISERHGPMSADGVRKMLARTGEEAGLSFSVHPHMLRHACGFKLANDGHDTRALQLWLGHRNIQHTVRYTELSPARFKNFWRD
jgi:type 1 fimbriae regulatory protein FimB/type 1 fimbriae regulatory protein FimE